jgi:hypothetical protein
MKPMSAVLIKGNVDKKATKLDSSSLTLNDLKRKYKIIEM